jgi:PKD repeat protein
MQLYRWRIKEIGTLDQIGFQAPINLVHAPILSLSFWYIATDSNKKQTIVNIGSHLEIYLEHGFITAEIESNDAIVGRVKCRQPMLGKWHHVVLVISDKLQLYVDQQIIHKTRLTKPINLSSETIIHIGGHTDAAGGHFDHTFGRNQTGLVDDLRIYDQILSEQDILELQPKPIHIADFNITSTPIDSSTLEFSVITNGAELDDDVFFLWDFGDGYREIERNIRHTYAFSGVYSVCLTVINYNYKQAKILSVEVKNGADSPEITPVFTNGEEYACYRIPSIVKAINGDLIAFAEARLDSCSDSTPVIRLVCKRSQDNGRTWSPVQIIATNILGSQEFAVQQNAPVVDVVYDTGSIIILYNKLESSEFDIAEGTGSSRIFCIRSDDNGLTWHSEKDISSQVHRADKWRVQRPTLGHAIQLQSGRLLFVGMMTEGEHSVFQSQNYVFWSDDLGETWHTSHIIPHVGLNEATAVELENNDVMINSRAYQDEQPVGKRAITIGRFIDDMTMQFDDTYFDDILIEPTVQASLIRYTYSQETLFGEKSRILFCNPNNPNARYNLTIRLSYDEGMSWKVSKTIDPGPSAYSDLVIQDNMDIGVLYEKGNHGGIFYTNFTLKWLSNAEDSIIV